MQTGRQVPPSDTKVGLLRLPLFPFSTSTDVTVELSPACAGFAIVVLKSLNSHPPTGGSAKPKGERPPWFDTFLVSKAKATFRVPTEEAFVIDFEDGFDPTPTNIWIYARQYLIVRSRDVAEASDSRDAHGGPG